jgi:hypothetical protein
MQRLLLLLSVLCTLSARPAQIQLAYNLAPAEAQVAIAHAAGIWEGILVSPVPIKVLVNWVPMGNTALGVTFPNGRRDFSGAIIPDTWYATALANALAGTELDPGENDIDIFLNSQTDWYFGTDGNTPAGLQDLVSVALHELGHGLGFVGLAKKTGTQGSFGLLQLSDFAPLFTTFPWPQLDTLPGIFDRFLDHPQDGPLELLENPGDALGGAMTSNQLRWSGAHALEASGGTPVRIYSPGTFALGSSCVHLNESTYPAGNPNELMTPFSSAGNANHWPGPICLGILKDIGWTLAPEVTVRENAWIQVPALHPNPVTDVLHLATSPGGSDPMLVLDAQGQVLRTLRAAPFIDLAGLAPGHYLLCHGPLRSAFIKL